MQTLWTFRTANFTVDLAWDYESDPDPSWDESGETTAKLESGEWVSCVFRVRLLASDGIELAANYLGNSIHADPADFRDHLGINAPGCSSYFTDMVRTVLREGRAEIKSLGNLAQLVHA